MPHTIDTPRPDYTDAADDWQKCRDVLAGSRAVKAAGSSYLPMLHGQKDVDYQAYKLRALFYNGTARTQAALVGTVFRKPADIEAPDAFEPTLRDVTLHATPFQSFALTALEEVIGVGRFGVLVDMQGDSVPAASRRPYLIPYAAEQIIDWDTDSVDGQQRLVYLVLKSCGSERQADHSYVDVERYKVCALEGTVYTVTEYEKKDDKITLVKPTVTPLRRGAALDFIPFVAINCSSLGLDVDKPPLLDMVEVNLSHYRTSADYEHGLHFVALPTPWVVGAKASGGELRIGAGIAWHLSGPDAKAGYLEFTGKGLGEFHTALTRKEEQMAVLGARLIESKDGGQPETAEAVRAKHAATHSVLKTIATTVSHGLTQAIRWAAWWQGVTAKPDDETITVALNTEFFEGTLTADEIKTLLLLVQSGQMSFSTFYHLMAKGEWTRPGVDAETELADIAKDQPIVDPSTDPQADAVPAE